MQDEHNNNSTPLTPVGDGAGREADGRFARGNKLARGNPYNRRAQRIRAEVFRHATVKRLGNAIDRQVEAAEGGDLEALKFLLDRSIGKVAADSLLIERIEKLEQLAAQQRANNGNGVHR